MINNSSGGGGPGQPYLRLAGPPTPTGTQQPPGPTQPMTRPVRPPGDPGMHPGQSYDLLNFSPYRSPCRITCMKMFMNNNQFPGTLYVELAPVMCRRLQWSKRSLKRETRMIR